MRLPHWTSGAEGLESVAKEEQGRIFAIEQLTPLCVSRRISNEGRAGSDTPVRMYQLSASEELPVLLQPEALPKLKDRRAIHVVDGWV